MPELPIRGLPSGDSGRLLVRLNHLHRSGVPRYGIARITNNANGKSLNVLLLGHEQADAIFMPYDIRDGLKASKNGNLDFTIQQLGWIGKLCWYIKSVDPAVQVPAIIAVVGTVLAIAGLLIGIWPLI